MTPEEAAIRERDAAEWAPGTAEVSPKTARAIEDRHDLIALLDAERADAAATFGKMAAEVERLRRYIDDIDASWVGIVDEAEATERARIRAAVEGLPTVSRVTNPVGPLTRNDAVRRAAVLAAIDGEGEA